MKSRDDKPPRAWNSTIAQRSKPMNRGPGPKRSARLASEIAPSRKPVRRKKRTPSEFARIYGSKARVLWVKSLECFAGKLSPCAGEMQNAHTVSGGKGRKADADTIVAACFKHHDDYDNYRAPFNIPEVREQVRRIARDTEAAWQSRTTPRGRNNGSTRRVRRSRLHRTRPR